MQKLLIGLVFSILECSSLLGEGSFVARAEDIASGTQDDFISGMELLHKREQEFNQKLQEHLEGVVTTSICSSLLFKSKKKPIDFPEWQINGAFIVFFRSF